MMCCYFSRYLCLEQDLICFTKESFGKSNRIANFAVQGHAEQVHDSQILNPAALISSSL